MAFSESTGNNGIIMGADGINMSGTWQNPTTGHKFTVRDTFFQDGQLVVQDTTGRMYDYNMIQNYVQVTDGQGNNISLPVQTPRTGTEKKKEELPAEVASLIMGENEKSVEDSYLTEEDKQIMAGLGNINAPATMAPGGERAMGPVDTYVATQKQEIKDPDYEMIDRVLKRHSIPELNADLSWPKVPQKQIETLVDILGVEPESIANYYIGKLDKDAIFEVVKSGIVVYINALLGGDQKQEVTPDPVKPVVVKPLENEVESKIVAEGPGELEVLTPTKPVKKTTTKKTTKKTTTKKK